MPKNPLFHSVNQQHLSQHDVRNK